MKRVAIIDYGVGNIYSIQKLLEYLDISWVYSSDEAEILRCRGIILPGVGAYKDASEAVFRRKLDSTIRMFAASGKPVLGICLGMQLLFEGSCEGGEYKGLGLVRGMVKRLPSTVKVPHTGWNSIEGFSESGLLKGISVQQYVYYTHSYYAEGVPEENVTATTDYGVRIPAVICKENIYGAQFHPEKSGEVGKKMIMNFKEMLI
ncbi:MAG: imidazole glycerol phosphate synthase subunit HisH [Bacillota bacterium]